MSDNRHYYYGHHKMNKNIFKKSILVGIVLCIIALVWYFKNSRIESNYFTPVALATHFNDEQFAGSISCMECHADIYNTHIQTAHYNTSAKASEISIKGSFEEGKNTLSIQDVNISMLHHDDSFFEQMDFKYENNKQSVSKIDIVIGSGVKGQSYLNWNQDKLYQIQTSYYTPTKSWINSPNFSNLSTKRPVSDACLKCHLTFAQNYNPLGNRNKYIKESMIYGIDCERCHRPAMKHVVYHRANPERTKSKFIMISDTLSRAKRLDVCAQCHSGLRSQQLKGSPFSFLAGENLNEHSQNYYTSRSTKELDVHGNQYGLLSSSKCFTESSNLDCTTCHNPHKNQRGNTSYFNQKCISCHNISTVECKAPASLTSSMGNNCISCHMPLSPSISMKVQLDKDHKEMPVYIRTHLIGIYTKTLTSEN